MPKVWNKRQKGIPEDAVYVGRPSRWGNPFSIGPTCTRADAVRKYKAYTAEIPGFLTEIRSNLRGKDLVCWCAPKACHADILLEIANSEENARTAI
jgi:hypothetical protein